MPGAAFKPTEDEGLLIEIVVTIGPGYSLNQARFLPQFTEHRDDKKRAKKCCSPGMYLV